MRHAQFVIILLFLGFAAGCGSENPPSASSPPAKEEGPARRPFVVVTTCGMVTDIVQIVAGDQAKVIGLMGEGVDPHMYKPTRNDVKQLLDADIVFYSGLMLEGRMTDSFAKVARTGKPVYPVTEGIDESYLREPPEFAGHWDPHVWMDIQAWSACVAHVAHAFSEYDTANADVYLTNAASYQEKLDDLNLYARKSLATIPEAKRVLITAHDAFGYFAEAYNIEVKAVQGLSTESEPSLEDVANLVQFIVERKIEAIFVESSVSEKSIRAIIEGAQQQGWTIKVGGELFSDAMGASGTYQGTYLGMMDHNVTTITRALGGEAPESGWQGKLP